MSTRSTRTRSPNRDAVKIGAALVLALAAVVLGLRSFLFTGTPAADPLEAAMSEQVVAPMLQQRPAPPEPTRAERSVEPGGGKEARPVPSE